MCLDHKVVGDYKCCTVIPLMCGVIMIAVLNFCGLVTSYTFGDLSGIVLKGGMLVCFIVAFTKRDNHSIKFFLFAAYALNLAYFFGYLIYFIVSQDKMNAMIQQGCKTLN